MAYGTNGYGVLGYGASSSTSTDVSIGLTGSSLNQTNGSLYSQVLTGINTNNTLVYTGTLTVQSSTDITLSLTSLASTLNNGSLASTRTTLLTTSLFNTSSSSLIPALQLSTSGLNISSLLSDISKQLSVSLLGEVRISVPGSITVYDGSLVRALLGINSTSSTSTIIPIVSTGLIGTNLSLQADTLRGVINRSLSGVSSTLQQGISSFSFSKRLDGSVGVTGEGTLVFNSNDILIPITGNTLQSTTGILTIYGKIQKPIVKIVVMDTSYTLINISSDSHFQIDNSNKYIC